MKLRELNSESGTMGEATRLSTYTNRVRAPNPTPKLPRTRECLQPSVADSTNPNPIPARPTVATEAPIQSAFCGVELRDSGTCHNEIAITAAPRGTLMKKTQSQEACSINHPPRTGPNAALMAVNPDQVPIACPRAFSSTDAVIS